MAQNVFWAILQTLCQCSVNFCKSNERNLTYSSHRCCQEGVGRSARTTRRMMMRRRLMTWAKAETDRRRRRRRWLYAPRHRLALVCSIFLLKFARVLSSFFGLPTWLFFFSLPLFCSCFLLLFGSFMAHIAPLIAVHMAYV